jgi:hypothetical protein
MSLPSPAFVREAGRLHRPPDALTATRSQELIDAFIKKFGKLDVIEWARENTAARSELVVHPADRTLRIDLQPSPPGWANFQLQAGAFSLACVLVECGKKFQASDVKAAWQASLRETANMRMKWRFVASPMEMQVLNSLTPREARDIDSILSSMRARQPGPAVDSHFSYLHAQIPQILNNLAANGLVRRQGNGWLLMPSGIGYTV